MQITVPLKSVSKNKTRSPKQEAYLNLVVSVCEELGLDHPFDGTEEQTKEVFNEVSKRWKAIKE